MQISTVTPREIVAMAFDSIRAHKFRSALTVLGIVIGVSTVIAIASILTGLRENLVKLIQEYGTDNIYAFHLSTGFNINQDRSERTRKPLNEADAKAILEQTTMVEDAALMAFPDWNLNRTLTYRGYTYRRSNLQGVSANYAEVTNVAVEEGRFITEFDNEHKRNTMVIGVSVADALFWITGARSARRCVWATRFSKSSVCCKSERAHFWERATRTTPFTFRSRRCARCRTHNAG